MKSAVLKRFRGELIGYAFIFPALVLFLIFLIYPAVDAVRISFYQISLNASQFIGFDNYVNLAADKTFTVAFINTFKYVIVIVPLTVAFSIFVAVRINSMNEKATAVYRGIFYLPHIASAVTISLIWSWIYNPVIGIANYALSLFGLPMQEWLSSPDMAFQSVSFVILTASVGQPIILYSAALGGISRDYYEAAEIDGAGKLRQFANITWPLVKSTTLYILVISTISIFQIFVYIQILTNGGPAKSTTTIIYELYLMAFTNHNYGYASAMGVILFLVVGIVAFFQFRMMTSKVET